MERFLARVRGHLAPGGRFVFDTSVPAPADLSRDPSKPMRTRPFHHPTLGVQCQYAERFDYDPMRQILFISMEFAPRPRSRPARSAESMLDQGGGFMTPLAHRQFFPAELEALLHYNGFSVERLEGGFREEPTDRHTDTLLWFCRAQPAPRRESRRAQGPAR